MDNLPYCKSPECHKIEEATKNAKLLEICNRIYIARNISLSEKSILECLQEIDNILSDKENFN